MTNDRAHDLHTASLFQRVAASDHQRAARRLAHAADFKGKRRAEILSDAAAFQLLAADNHKRAAELMGRWL